MALTKPIKGIIGACLTPFDDNDRVNYKALENEIDFLVTDCDAVTIAAVEAAEYTMLSRDERKELLKLATEMVGKRVPVILGCSRRSRAGAYAAPPLGRTTDGRRIDGVLHASRVGQSIAGDLLSQSRARRGSAAGRVRQNQRDRQHS